MFDKYRSYRGWYFCLSLASILLGWGSKAAAQNSASSNFSALANVWLLVAGTLVFFMNAGFAMLEAGFCRRQNATNVLAKNLIVFCVATLAYWLFGFGFMFGDGASYSCPGEAQILSFIGQPGIGFDSIFPKLGEYETAIAPFSCFLEDWPDRSLPALFFFQLVFAGTTATIVSGAVAERIKFWAFALFSFLLVGFSYPLTGHWVWGHYGWLVQALGFRDFAGSTVVHSVGGTAALVGTWLLKPRQGRFGYDVKQERFEADETEDFTPANLGLSTLGCFILWLGWFGFNGGSTTYLEYVPHIFVTTMIATAAGGISAILFSPIVIGKPSLGSMINGILGGLVAITASSAFVNFTSSFIIGAIGGIFVLFGESVLEVCRIDDPVGAVPVHLFGGFWGTLAVGIFSSQNSLVYASLPINTNPLQQTYYQLLGWLMVCMVTGLFSAIAWVAIGILLHYLSEIDRWLSWGKSLRVSIPNGQSAWSCLVEHYKLGIKAIRVSLSDEKKGSDGVFYDL